MATRLRDDAARRWTDAELASLERRMRREYAQAASEMRVKQAKWLEKFEREREQREKALDSTREAMEAHREWLSSQAARGDWLGGMADQLAQSAHQANVRAMDMVNGHIPRVYAENANRAAFAVDRAVGADTGFTLVNEDAVRHLMGVGETGGQLVPEVVGGAAKLGPADVQSLRKRTVDAAKDIRWNRQKFTSAITQGILQGESIPNIAKRTESVFGQNRSAAVRAARTATTNAENAGRMSSFGRAQRLGIDMEIEWSATLDGRTRDSHRALDGERIQLGETFGNGLRWPGDPQGDASEVYNCRCRADGRVVGFDGERGDWADEERDERWSRLPEGTTYGQWKSGKAISRAESYESKAGRVSGAWYSKPRVLGGDIVSQQPVPAVASAPFDEAVMADKLETYVGGGYDLDDLMTQEEFEWMHKHEQTYDKALYRVEDRRFTAASIDSQVAAGVEDVEVDFNATYRSFTQGGNSTLEELLEQSMEYAEPDDFVIFRTMGKTDAFDMAKYVENYMDDQKEVLVGGDFEFWGEEAMEIAGHVFRVFNIMQVR